MIRGPYAPYAEILRHSFRHSLEDLGYRCPGYAPQAFVESLGRWRPFPDVFPALIRLAARFRLAIISNTDRDLLGRSLRPFPVRFDALITAEDARTYKPNLDMFRHALSQLAAPPEEILHVAFGADYDLRPAASLGFRTVFLNRSGLPPPEMPVEAEIKTLEELPRLWDA